jgi:hypothetical protein
LVGKDGKEEVFHLRAKNNFLAGMLEERRHMTWKARKLNPMRRQKAKTQRGITIRVRPIDS